MMSQVITDSVVLPASRDLVSYSVSYFVQSTQFVPASQQNPVAETDPF